MGWELAALHRLHLVSRLLMWHLVWGSALAVQRLQCHALTCSCVSKRCLPCSHNGQRHTPDGMKSAQVHGQCEATLEDPDFRRVAATCMLHLSRWYHGRQLRQQLLFDMQRRELLVGSELARVSYNVLILGVHLSTYMVHEL